MLVAYRSRVNHFRIDTLIHFQNIFQLLWLLSILPVILLLLYAHKWRQNIKQKMGNERLINLMMAGLSTARRRWKAGLIIAAVALLGFAMPNLQKPVQEAGAGLKGLDVMIALDVSNSMLATDEQPNRLEKARLLASKLIDYMQGNRVGIIAFAGDAYLQLPLTTDITAARLYLQSISTSLVPRQGTNIFDALQLANRSMDPAEHQYKAVVLITDGEELDKKAIEAATELKKSGVVILPIGIGSPTGATIPDENGETKKDEKGQVVISKLNDKMLKELAGITNGTYRPMGETDETLQSLKTELSAMDQKPISNTNLMNFKSYSHWMIGAALLLLLIEIILPERIGKIAVKTSTENKKKNGLQKAAALFSLLLFISVIGFSQSTKLLLRKANEAYRMQQYAQAEKLYSEVLKIEPNNAIAKYNMGNIAFRKKQFDKAVKQYEEASEKADKKVNKAGADNNKGLSYVEQKNLQKAIDAFKQSIRENPYDSEVRNNLNKALQEKQKQDEQEKKNQPDSNQQKQPPPPKQENKQNKNQMKKNDAEDKLAALRQEEKKIRDKAKKQPGQAGGSDKDW
jgi:Ca-activated chloride channel family protein